MDISFPSWERRRRDIRPEPERIIPLVVAAGSAGMTRQQLGHAVDIERDMLEELLAGMVGVGLLVLSRDARGPVYRATSV